MGKTAVSSSIQQSNHHQQQQQQQELCAQLQQLQHQQHQQEQLNRLHQVDQPYQSIQFARLTRPPRIKSPKIKDNTLSTLTQSANDDQKFLFSNLNNNNNNNSTNTYNNPQNTTYTLTSAKETNYPHQPSFSGPSLNNNFAYLNPTNNRNSIFTNLFFQQQQQPQSQQTQVRNNNISPRDLNNKNNTMMHYQQQQHPQQPQQLQQSQQQTQQQSQQQSHQPHSLQQSFNPISATGQQYQQYQQPSQLFNPQQSVQQYLQQPIRPRGDSIVLPPPIRLLGEHLYENGTNGNQIPSTSRSNSIFSSLINLPGSSGNSISEPSVSNPGSASGKNDIAFNTTNGNKNNNNTTTNNNNNNGAPLLPPTTRSRQMSLGQSQDFTMEDLENFLNKESMSNIFNWLNDPKLSISGGVGGNISGNGIKSKGNSIDFTNWNEGNNNTGYNNSITELLQNMISNGSIDFNSFSNMSNQQRRDSILKIINDQNSLRSQRSSSDQSRNTNASLREDIFDRRNPSQSQQQQQSLEKTPQQSASSLSKQKLSPRQRKSPQQQQQQQRQQLSNLQQNQRGQVNTLGVPGDKDNVSPTSSSHTSPKFQEDPQSPKASPVAYGNIRVNEPFASGGYQQVSQMQQQQQQRQHQQQQNRQQQQQQPQQPQRLFQNYSVSPQNQYQYSAYPNYNQLGYSNVQQSLANARNNSFSNYIYPVQTQQQQQQQQQQQFYPPPSQQQQQYIPPAATTTKPPGYMPQQQQPPPPSQQQQSKSADQKKRKSSVKRTRRTKKDQNSNSTPTTNMMTTQNLSSPESRNLVPAQQFAQSEDGRPLLGATKIDQLMLVIQARDKGITNPIEQGPDGSILASPDNFSLGRSKAELDSGILPRPVSLVGGVDKPHKRDEDEIEDSDDNGDGTNQNQHHQHQHKRRKHKNQQCPYCFKFFTQSTHLEVHIRSHIGYKPFECTYCHKKFTQGGNLRTHLRLHTGEKPFTCEICKRSFNRKGNLAAHKLTHDNLKPFECKLDNCDKSFTQLGNLKSHQNRFHLDKLNELTHRLAELSGPALNNLPNEEKELLLYFKDLYKNSNKGIRGRGKAHKEDNQGNSNGKQSGTMGQISGSSL